MTIKTIAKITILASLSSSIFAKEITAFGVGEKLFYELSWKGIPGAYAMIEVKKRFKYKGRNAFHLKARMTTRNTAVDKIFKIRNKIECYWDIKKRQPLYPKFTINEGYYKRRLSVYYNLFSSIASYTLKEYKGNTHKRGVKNNSAKWEYKKGTKKVPKDFQDIFAAFYMMRANETNGKPGQKFSLRIFTDKKVDTMLMQILRRDIVDVPAGRFKAVKVQPFVKGNKFFVSYGRVYIWVSVDENRYPVKIETKVPLIGTVDGKLVKIIKPNND